MHRSHVRDKRYEAHCQELHEQKLNDMKAAVDNKSPPTYPHLNQSTKTKQLEMERLTSIEVENARLVKKMNEIKSKPSTLDNKNQNQHKHSLNKDSRQRELDRIASENEAFVKRMISNPPSYSKNKWEEEREKQVKYLKTRCEYPVLDHHLTIGKTSKEGTASTSPKPVKKVQKPKKLPPVSKKTSAGPVEDEKRPASTNSEDDNFSLSDSDDDTMAKDDHVYKPDSDSDLDSGHE